MNRKIGKLLTAVMLIILGTLTAAPALAYHEVEYARVVNAEPIYREVRVGAPQQECRDERVIYREPAYRESYGGGNGAQTLIGAIIGGIAGHQIGGGRGRDVATAAGAVIGSQYAQNHVRGYGYSEPVERVAYEPHCTTYNNYRYEQRVEGYDVTYRYGGRLYYTRMPYDPGRRVPVDIAVRPTYDDDRQLRRQYDHDYDDRD